MKYLILPFILLTASTASFAQDLLSPEQQAIGEAYASYISHKSFVSVCTDQTKDKNYQLMFERWLSKNKKEIDSGFEVLENHYSSQGLNVDEVFKWKTEAELRYFTQSSSEEKGITCNRVMSFISE